MSNTDISKLNKKQQEDDSINHIGLTQKEVTIEIESRMSLQGSDDYNKLKKIYKSMVDTREEMNANREELKEVFPKELEKLEETQNKVEQDFRFSLLYFNPSNDEEQIFVDMVMLKIMRESDGNVDNYGIPKSVIDTDEKDIDRLIKLEVDKKLDELFTDKEIVKEMREKNIPQEKIDEFRKQLRQEGIGAFTKIILQVLGGKFQNPIRKLGSLFTGAIKRSTKFKRKGSSDKTKQLYIKIQKQAQHLQSLDRYKMTHIIKKLADEHNKSESYIKDIIYKDLSK